MISLNNVGNPLGYAGYHFDAELQVYLARHRYHDPVLGRWLTRDPAGYVDGMNLYLYGLGSPFVFVDPMGLESWLSRCNPWSWGRRDREWKEMMEENRGLRDAHREEHVKNGLMSEEGARRQSFDDRVGLENTTRALEQGSLDGQIQVLETGVEGAVVAATAPVGGALVNGGSRLLRGGRVADIATDAGKATSNAQRMNRVRQAGQRGQDAAEAMATGRGNTILGRQVTMEAPNGVRVRFDFVSQARDGRIFFHEAKNGLSARLTVNQRMAFPQMNQPGWIPRGANAAEAGLNVGKRMEEGLNLSYSRFLLP